MTRRIIFIGFSEIANFVNTYSKGFTAIGHQTISVVSSKSKYYPDAQYDIVLSDNVSENGRGTHLIRRALSSLKARLKAATVFLYALSKCDAFFYIAGAPLLPYAIDFRLIKLFRKRLAIIFLGSEIRDPDLYQQDLKRYGFDLVYEEAVHAYRLQELKSADERSTRVQRAERFADLILSQPGYAQLQRKPYQRASVGLYLPEYSFQVHGRSRPLILHAPSSRGIKGTRYVLDAIEKLRNDDLSFEFELIENMPNRDLIAKLVDADIVVDELNADTIGVLSTESMATGNAVLSSYISSWTGVPTPCPVINSNKETVYSNLKMAICDVEARKRLSIMGREYVEQHNDITTICRRDLFFLGIDHCDVATTPRHNN